MEVTELYKSTVLRTLGAFQLLEFALKLYIGRAYKEIKNLSKGIVHFDFSAKDVENFPLERLATLFSKLNENKELHSQINRLRESRNHLAHQSLLIVLGSKVDRGEVEDKFIEFTMVENDLSECLKKVISELQLLELKLKESKP